MQKPRQFYNSCDRHSSAKKLVRRLLFSITAAIPDATISSRTETDPWTHNVVKIQFSRMQTDVCYSTEYISDYSPHTAPL